MLETLVSVKSVLHTVWLVTMVLHVQIPGLVIVVLEAL